MDARDLGGREDNPFAVHLEWYEAAIEQIEHEQFLQDMEFAMRYRRFEDGFDRAIMMAVVFGVVAFAAVAFILHVTAGLDPDIIKAAMPK